MLDRFIHYQKLSLAVRKKVMVSLMYPCVLIVLVIFLMVFLVTFVVPRFASLYESFHADLPAMTRILITVGTTAQSSILAIAGGVVAAIVGFPLLGAARIGADHASTGSS